MEPHSRVTLKRVAFMARMLYRIRSILLLAGIAAGIWLAVAIWNPATQSDRLLLPISLIMWAGLGLAVGYTLPALPPSIEAADGLRVRIKKRIGQFGYGLAVLVMLGLAVFALIFTYQAATLILI